MRYWEFASFSTLLWVGVLLGITTLLCRAIPLLKKSRVPHSILAGALGLILGSGLLGIIPFSEEGLKFLIYHGLAITFIAIGLQAPPSGSSTPNTVAMGLAMPFMAVLQGLVGLSVVLLLSSVLGEDLHPGLGLLLPLGFNQGPGQAMSLGEAWEATGFIDGGQLGLIIAAVGFAWSVICGIPLVYYLQRKGFISSVYEAESTKETSDDEFDPLSQSISVICLVYLICFGVLNLLHYSLESNPGHQGMIWGFHFLIALIISVLMRIVYKRVTGRDFQRRPLGQITNLSVDWVTCSAIAAIQITILQQNRVAIVVLTSVGLVLTLGIVMWWGSRGFSSDKAEHAIVWFGASTGTLPMGLALLRMVDPKLQSAAPSSVAMGSMISLVASVPLLILVMPYVINNYPEGHPQVSIRTLGILFVYAVVLGGIWWKFSGIEMGKARQFWRQ